MKVFGSTLLDIQRLASLANHDAREIRPRGVVTWSSSVARLTEISSGFLTLVDWLAAWARLMRLPPLITFRWTSTRHQGQPGALVLGFNRSGTEQINSGPGFR